MSPEERRTSELFAKLWGSRSTSSPPSEGPSAAKLERLKNDMLAKRGVVDNRTARYVESALVYGIEQTRSEYRPLASRNWRAIQKFGVRLIRGLLALAVILLFLGWRTLATTSDIQHDRRNSVIQKCEAGEHFDRKLREQIARLPEPEKARSRANIALVEALVATLVPIEHDHCRKALQLAGLEP